MRHEAQRTGQDLVNTTVMDEEAKEFIKGLVEGRKVRLEYDVEKRDKHGRLLAYVYWRHCPIDKCNLLHEFLPRIKIFPDGKCGMLNAKIIEAGYASPLTIPPNVKYADLFQRLYQEARENNRGLWK